MSFAAEIDETLAINVVLSRHGAVDFLRRTALRRSRGLLSISMFVHMVIDRILT